MSDWLDRLLAGYYNSDPYDASTNPGGLAGGGHVVNFPAALGDFANSANDVQQAQLDAQQVSLDKAQVAADKAYVQANARPGFGARAVVPAAATTDLGAASTRFIQVTGSATITSFGSSASTDSPLYVAYFPSAGTVITHNISSLACPGGVNITTQGHDYMLLQYASTGAWRVLAVFRNNGTALTPSPSTPEATIASASTTTLATAGGNLINITGSNTIVSFGSGASSAAPLYFLRFSGALLLGHSAQLALPGAANITTAAGDFAVAQYVTSSTWRVLAYHRADGTPVVAGSPFGAETSLASAATTDLGSAGSRLVTITGTTTITAFGSSAGTGNPIYLLRFQGAVTLTHHATNFILPGGANYTTAAGDYVQAQYMGAGAWRVLAIFNADGKLASAARTSAAQVWAGTEAGAAMTPASAFAAAASIALADGATITPDGSAGFNFHVTLGGNRTLANPTNFKSGQSGRLRITQDATGGRALTWGSNWKFPGGYKTLSTAAGAIDVVAYYVHTDGTIECALLQGFA